MKNLELDFFKIKNEIEPQAGKILASGPFLQDVYFSRSIVLLTEHNSKGTIGFVINKPVITKISELVPDFPDFKANISMGGPVSMNSIHYIHNFGSLLPDSVPVMDGLYWGGNFDILKELIINNAIKPADIKFFIGYSGWSPGQLEQELDEHSWIVSELNAKQLLKKNANIWKETLTTMGDKFKIWANFPENPGLN